MSINFLLSLGAAGVIISPGRNWHSHETYQNVGNYALPQSSWWVYPVPNDTIHPSSYQVMNSDFQSGSLASVGSSDNSRLSIGYNRSTRIGKDGSATIQFTSTFPTLPDLALRVYVEAKATGRGMKQQISLWNYTTNAFDIVDTRPATSADTFALARTE